MVKQIGVFVIGLVIGFLLLRSCGPVKEKLISFTDTIYGDSVPYIVIHERPVPYKVVVPDSFFHTDSILVYVPVEVRNDFYSAFYYSDTLQDDSSALIILDEQISQNMVEFRQHTFLNRRPTVINNHYPANKNKIHLGAIGGLNGVSFEAGYSYGKNQFGLLYGTPGVQIGYRRTIAEW